MNEEQGQGGENMEKRIYYIVDVFTEEKYAGNQLAVVRNAKTLQNGQMQRIAKEMNFSETTFILDDEKHKGGYNVRIFTPREEVPFAGHPTLGTAFIIQQEIVQKPVKEILLNLKVGQILVSFTYEGRVVNILWMKQIQPAFGRILEPAEVARVLSLDLKDMETRFPIQEVSTGLPFIIVPLKTLEASKKSSIDKEKMSALIRKTEAKAILVFCPETYNPENNLNVRVYADYYGVPEDPATGSANGCLAGYLVKCRYFGKPKIDVRVEQGYEIDRPSLLLLRAEEKKGKIHVLVGGKAAMVARGELV